MQGLIQVRFRDQPALERFGQRLVRYPAAQIVARLDRQRGSFRRILRIVVALHDVRDRIDISDHRALKAPRVPQDLGQQPVIRRGGHAVERVVRAHQGRGVTLPDARLERGQVGLVQVALGDHRIELVPQRFRTAVHVKVLHRGDRLQVTRIIPLEPRDEGDPEAAGQERILAVGLLAPAPARIAEDVDVRRPEGQVVELPCLHPFGGSLPLVLIVLGPDLRRDHPRNGVVQIGVPRRGQSNRLRENRGRAAPRHSVQGLTPPAEVQYPQPRDGGAGHHQLADFLVHGHPPDEIIDALVERQSGIEAGPGRVRGIGTVCRLRRGPGQRREKKNGEEKGAVDHGGGSDDAPSHKAHRRAKVAPEGKKRKAEHRTRKDKRKECERLKDFSLSALPSSFILFLRGSCG